jgi:hypothetical protein
MLVLASYTTFTFKYVFRLLHIINRCWFVNTPKLRDRSDYTNSKKIMVLASELAVTLFSSCT